LKFIIGDEYSIEQIFRNLLENAIKYTNDGKIAVTIYDTSDNKIALDIKDTGIGISEDFLPKMFENFTQEQQGYTRKYDGNGLGLSLVKGYCELNDIEINVESIKGKGSCFTLLFNKTIK
jgi:signal transduction histidine kinase